MTHTNLVQNEFRQHSGFPTNAVCPGEDNLLLRNCWDEPYLLQVGFRTTWGAPGSTTTWAVGTDTRICSSTTRQYGPTTCVVGPDPGRIGWPAVRTTSSHELSQGSARPEVVGMLTLAMEKDTPTPGPTQLLAHAAELVREWLEGTVELAPDTLGDGTLAARLVAVLGDIAPLAPIGVRAFQLLGPSETAADPDDLLGWSLSAFPALDDDAATRLQTDLAAAGLESPARRTTTAHVPEHGPIELALLVNIRPLAPATFDLDYDAAAIGIRGSLGSHRYTFDIRAVE